MSALFETCPICGKRKAIMWPEFWIWRRGETFYCSEMCLETSYVRDRNMIKWAYQKRKEAKKMEKMKKDGTPAKKPGPKKKDGIAQVKVDGALRIETPEANKIEIVETPEKPKTPVKAYKVTGIRTENFGEFYYDQKFNSIDWRTEEGDEISLPPIGWKNLMQEMPDILKALGVKL